ncbi:MAG: hypothetical protein HFACDABA_01029 [Anaerolineales bacterium]|nr:hypothetical protein [Anaerolineales bacterium]
MIRKLWIVLAAGLILSACLPAQPVATTGPGLETIVAATFQAMTAAAPPPTATAAPPNGIPISFQHVRFIIPEGLALGANAEVVPLAGEENSAPWDVAPEHIRFELYGYNDQLAKARAMDILVYPAQEYARMSVGGGRSLSELQAFLAAPGAPIIEKNLPTVPFFNAAQMIAAQVKQVNFASGTGVRMMVEYGQAVGAISNSATLYHFQGLTSDGMYYIVAILPLGASILINGGDPLAPPPPGGVQFPGYTTLNPSDYESYFQAVTSALNSADPTVFSPSLETLDALMESITISTP